MLSYGRKLKEEGCKVNDSSFTLWLKAKGVQHIKARVKHPQTNGKVERVKQTIEKLWNHLNKMSNLNYQEDNKSGKHKYYLNW